MHTFRGESPKIALKMISEVRVIEHFYAQNLSMFKIFKIYDANLRIHIRIFKNKIFQTRAKNDFKKSEL